MKKNKYKIIFEFETDSLTKSSIIQAFAIRGGDKLSKNLKEYYEDPNDIEWEEFLDQFKPLKDNGEQTFGVICEDGLMQYKVKLEKTEL